MSYKYLKKCRGCGSNYFLKYLNLGYQPLANSFLKKKELTNEKKYPLELILCQKCKLSQLSIVVSSKKIFNDYDYLSSSSMALREHYKKLVDYILKNYKVKKNENVLDIGCNDGVLLANYGDNLNIIGVEPSNVCKFIRDKRIKVYNNFFDKKLALIIKKKYKNIKVITMTNVLAHIDNLNDIIANISIILSDNGIFVIEVPYIYDMLKKYTFDVVYHEHLSYFSLSSLKYIFNKNKFEIYDVKRIKFGASGPCLRIFVKKKNILNSKKSVNKLLKFEKKIGLNSDEIYVKFSSGVNKVIQKIQKKIDFFKKKKIPLACYTAPAKGNTLLNALNLNNSAIKYVSENNKKKIGKYTPGTHLKIVTDKFLEKNKIKYSILLSWNYKNFFLKNSRFIKTGGKFIIPFSK
jgi:2-polyprenyl-3-methyl-5-hydroxy-6-metoxy-1,4-benzoquinol methylase